jgi:hypothetical protein
MARDEKDDNGAPTGLKAQYETNKSPPPSETRDTFSHHSSPHDDAEQKNVIPQPSRNVADDAARATPRAMPMGMESMMSGGTPREDVPAMTQNMPRSSMSTSGGGLVSGSARIGTRPVSGTIRKPELPMHVVKHSAKED